MEKLSDSVITSVMNFVERPLRQIIDFTKYGDFGEVMLYIAVALIILLSVYIVEVISNYMQSRLMITVSQNSIEQIRNDLIRQAAETAYKIFRTITLPVNNEPFYKRCRQYRNNA